MPSMQTPLLDFKYIKFHESFDPAKLVILDDAWQQYLAKQRPDLAQTVMRWRQPDYTPESPVFSAYIIALAPILADFVAEIFGVAPELQDCRQRLQAREPIYWFKTKVISAQLRRYKVLESDLNASLINFSQQSGLSEISELSLALWAESHQETWQSDPASKQLLFDLCANLMALHRTYPQDPPGQESCSFNKSDELERDYLQGGGENVADLWAITRHWVWLRTPQKLDFAALLGLEVADKSELVCVKGHSSASHSDANTSIQPVHLRSQTLTGRQGFDLLDNGQSYEEIQNEANYCIFCHEKDNDFCRKGFPAKDAKNAHDFKRNPLQEELTGCPLDEKVSEMNLLRSQGLPLAALAVAMLDNPLVAATGHRICNDCMKSCIYQKQTPVNIPEIGSSNLREVLALPWGLEIYDLLIRWNPLRRKEYLPKPLTGRRVAVMGMGPAGFTLAHHLTMAGHTVVGFDGLKIEPLDVIDVHAPILKFSEFAKPLTERIIHGFGGVAEYGITSRWEKNYLTLIYLSLLRRANFSICGGVRFGGGLKVEDAWRLGFDHLVLAVGAGLPRELKIPGSMAPGMRHANDFLMSLQLTDLARVQSMISYDLELPALIIGGGLTGVDAATEIQAYYFIQIKRVAERFIQLEQALGRARLLQQFTQGQLKVIHKFSYQNRLLERCERWYQYRQKRRAQGQTGLSAAQFRKWQKQLYARLIHRWGGVKIVYRRHLIESPAYQRNHEELDLALKQGVEYLQGLQPLAAILDSQGRIASLRCAKRVATGGVYNEVGTLTLPARTILLATGAQPNIAYEYEHRGTFIRQGNNYQGHVASEQGPKPQTMDNCKDNHLAVLTSYDVAKRRVSFIGDSHPAFHGSVVKAMASGMRASATVTQLLDKQSTAPEHVSRSSNPQQLVTDNNDFLSTVRALFTAQIVDRRRMTADLVWMRISAPFIAGQYQPGQFLRLQNFMSNAPQLEEVGLHMEPVAMTPFAVDQQNGFFDFVVWERGTSSKILGSLEVGSYVSLMGPTGAASPEQAQGTKLLLVDRLGLVTGHLAATAAQERGVKVIVAAAIEPGWDCDELVQHYLDAKLDIRVWRRAPKILHRELARLATELGEVQDLQILVTGLGDWISQARQYAAGLDWPASSTWQGAVFGPMQCMLKGICAQCLQWQVDPQTGQRTKAVYACSWNEQPLTWVDWEHLTARGQANPIHDKLNYIYLNHIWRKRADFYTRGLAD